MFLNEIYRKSMVVLVSCALVALAGCSLEPRGSEKRGYDQSSLDKASKSHIAIPDPAPTHCRTGMGADFWRIVPIERSGDMTDQGSYLIGYSWAYGRRDKVDITRGDDVELLELSDTSLRLVHTDKSGTNEAYADLTLHSSNLWFYGDAKKEDGRLVGKYYVFRLPNAEGAHNSRLCENYPNSRPGMCKVIHIEFFDSDDSLDKYKPVLNDNVKKLHLCRDVGLESNEGDGDDGHD